MARPSEGGFQECAGGLKAFGVTRSFQVHSLLSPQ